ncbi:transporter substrate-binding domain-containing protein [Lentzea sp. NPDC058450]|uniref:transporter substrate-binding domain-containing protein n=1 Tax=Lentzea sp. NPDC058450 TaxID=3346505 RepID=UPI00364AE61B
MSTEQDVESAANSFSIRGQLYWILPITLATMSITVWLLTNPQWGGDVAAIVVIPINVAAVLVPLMMAYGANGTGARRANPLRMRRLKMAVAFTLSTLLVITGVYLVNREGDPLDYLKGTLRVGVIKEEYAGWNKLRTDGSREGFDAALVDYLKTRYPAITEIKYVELNERDERISALEGSRRADIVISNFSITPAREERIDFAGPYYYDKQGFFTWGGELVLEDVTVGEVCTASGITGNARLTELGWQPTSERSLAKCMQQFLDNPNSTKTVSTDTSILQAYAKDRKNRDNPNSPSTWQIPNGIELGQEKYGIGIPNNRPRLCEELNKAITDFLNGRWGHEFDKHLAGVDKKDDHMPKTTDTCKQPSFF